MYILKIFGIWEVKQTWTSHTMKNTTLLFSIGIWKPNLIFVCHFLQASLVFFKDIASFPSPEIRKLETALTSWWATAHCDLGLEC